MSAQIISGQNPSRNASNKTVRRKAQEEELRLQLRFLERTSNDKVFSQIIQNLSDAETNYQKQLKYYFDMIDVYNNWKKSKKKNDPKNAETIIVIKIENARKSVSHAFFELARAVRRFEMYGNEDFKTYTKHISDFFRNKYKLDLFVIDLPELTIPQLEDPSLLNTYVLPALAPSSSAGSGLGISASGGLSASGTGSSVSTTASASSVNTALAERIYKALNISLKNVGGLKGSYFNQELPPLSHYNASKTRKNRRMKNRR